MVAQLDKAGVESDVKLIENEPKVKNNFICSLISKKGDENTFSGRKITSEFLRDHCLTDGAGSELVGAACRVGACGGFMCGLYNTRRGERYLARQQGKNRLFTIN